MAKYIDSVLEALREFREARNVLCSTHGYRHYRDETVIEGDWIVYKYHGNIIARYNAKERLLEITDAGWCTPSTRDRLNGILRVFGIHRYDVSLRRYTLMYLWDSKYKIGLVNKDVCTYWWLRALHVLFNASTGEILNMHELEYYLPGTEREVYYTRGESLVSKSNIGLWRKLGYRVLKNEDYGFDGWYLYTVEGVDKVLYYKAVFKPTSEVKYFKLKYNSCVGGWVGVEIRDKGVIEDVDRKIRRAKVLAKMFR